MRIKNEKWNGYQTGPKIYIQLEKEGWLRCEAHLKNFKRSLELWPNNVSFRGYVRFSFHLQLHKWKMKTEFGMYYLIFVLKHGNLSTFVIGKSTWLITLLINIYKSLVWESSNFKIKPFFSFRFFFNQKLTPFQVLLLYIKITNQNKTKRKILPSLDTHTPKDMHP